MARLAFWGPVTQYDSGFSASAPVFVQKNNVNGDKPGFCIRSLGGTGLGAAWAFGTPDAAAAPRTNFYLRFKIRIRRLPTVTKSFWYTTSSGEGGPGLVLRVTPAGKLDVLNLGNQVYPGSLIATSVGSLNVGVTSAGWNTIKLFLKYAVGSADTGILQLYLNSETVYDNSVSGTIPGSNAGVQKVQNCNNFAFEPVPANPNNTGLDYDLSNISVDSTAIPGETQVTLVPVVSQGFYNNWTGGNAGYQYRQQMFNSAAVNEVSTALTSTRHSYVCQNMRDLGITGNIVAVSVVGQAGFGVAAQTAPLFIRRNGADVDSSNIAWSAAARPFHTALFSPTGWTPDDVVEIGFASGAGAGTYRWRGLWLVVEHDTPFVDPILQDFKITRGNYTGTAAYQGITLPFEPEFLLIWPRSTTTTGVWWHQGLWAYKNFQASPGTCLNGIWHTGTTLHLMDGDASYNANLVVYDYLAISDPQNRIWGSRSWLEVNQTVPYDSDLSQIVLPIEPAGIFASTETETTSLGANNQYFFGPGQANNTARTMQTAAVVADRIQLLNTLGWQAKRGIIGATFIQYTSWGLKPTAFETLKLTDIVTWTGDGTASRVIAVDVGGLTPVLAIAIPGNNVTAKYVKFSTFTDAHEWQVAASITTAITAFGANSITVGVTLNGLGVSYTMLVYAEGTDSAARNQYSGIYYLDPDFHHDTLWDRESGLPATVNVRIPTPIGRTYFVADDGKKKRKR
jgi:hypothetical protein